MVVEMEIQGQISCLRAEAELASDKVKLRYHPGQESLRWTSSSSLTCHVPGVAVGDSSAQLEGCRQHVVFPEKTDAR